MTGEPLPGSFGDMSATLRLLPRVEDDAREIRPPIRVALVDDHATVRRSLRLLLDDEEGVEVLFEDDDLSSATTRVRARRPDVLVLDFRMPGVPSGEMIAALRLCAPRTQIIVLTMLDNPAFAGVAIAAGALGFVRKDLADAELPEAVRTVARGEVYVSPEAAACA